jgi:hypothetical protein
MLYIGKCPSDHKENWLLVSGRIKLLYFFALSFPTSDVKRVEPSRFASEKLPQKSIYQHASLFIKRIIYSNATAPL